MKNFKRKKDESNQKEILKKMKKYEDSFKEKYGEDEKLMNDNKAKVDECTDKLEEQYEK